MVVALWIPWILSKPNPPESEGSNGNLFSRLGENLRSPPLGFLSDGYI